MANFKIAFDITNRNEGGYANNLDDKGGETYAGISRKNWPNWLGWSYVDEEKSIYHDNIAELNKALKADQVVRSLVENFYEKYFWDSLLLDQINDQQIGNAVYDFGVNSGTGTSAKKIQLAAGVTADGQIGPKTIAAINNKEPKTLYNAFCELRRAFYLGIIERDPSQKQFENSWLFRIKPYVD